MSNGPNTKIRQPKRRRSLESTTQVPTNQLVPGYKFDEKYELLELLAQGGMGEVFTAIHLILDQKVVVKILNVPGDYDQEAKARFLREAQIAVRLKHDNIININDAGISKEGNPYIAMPFLEGQSLYDWAKETPLEKRDILQIVNWIIATCEGLSEAHENNCIHRDIKPDNIFLHHTDNEQIVPQILDFGVARNMLSQEATRLTLPGQVIGTEGYMSPEQIKGEQTDHRTDIFALGTVLYELLTNTVTAPFEKPVPPSKVNQNVSRELDRICLMALEPSQNKRYQSIADMADDLCDFYNRHSAISPPADEVITTNSNLHTEYHPNTWSNKRRLIVGITGLGFIFTAVVMFILYEPPPVPNAHQSKSEKIQVIAPPLTSTDKNTTTRRSTKTPSKQSKQQPTTTQLSALENTGAHTDTAASNAQQADTSPIAAPTPNSHPSSPHRVKKQKNSNTPNKHAHDNATEKSVYAAHMKNAKESLRQANIGEAKSFYQKALAIKPRSAEALYGLGIVAREQGDYAQSEQHIKKALRQKDNGKWRLQLGKVLLKQSKQQEAAIQWKAITAGKYSVATKKSAELFIEKYTSNTKE